MTDDFESFAGTGDMRAHLRTHDYLNSKLGFPNTWPASLKTMVNVVLESTLAMWIGWGPELLLIYNDGYAKMLGAKHPDLLLKPYSGVGPEAWEYLGPIVAETVAGKSFFFENASMQLERNGKVEQVWFTYSLSPLRDEHGKVAGVFGTAIETTTHVLAELVRVAEEKRRVFQLSLADCIRPLETPDEVIAAASKMIGKQLRVGRVVYGTVDDTGKLIHIRRDWTDDVLMSLAGMTFALHDFGKLAVDVIRTGKPLIIENVNTNEIVAPYAHAYAEIGVCAVLALPLMKAGRLQAVLIIHDSKARYWSADEISLAHDMLDRTWSAAESAYETEKRLEVQQKLQDTDRRKDEFLAMLAHELRNPLAPIGAAAELLQIAKLDEAQVRKTSQIIARQVRHMTSLVDDLLDVSRVTQGLVEIDNSQLDVTHVITEAIEQMTPLIRLRLQHLTMELAAQASLVMGDKKRLVQVIANILSNAAKYTPEGGRILIRTEVRNAHVLIQVIDDGIGMTPEFVSRVFDLFAQAERTSDRSSGGLGLGLALVKSLINLHGGTVTSESAGLGKGSTFSVCLPRVLAEHGTNLDEDIRPSGGPHVKPLRIMVVDDNVDAASMLSMLLEAVGHEVIVEHGAHRALERAKTDLPEVFLLDIGLPEIDGNELAQRLRRQPETAQAVLIAVTGYGQDSDQQQSLAAGFDHHLVKPVDTKKLLAILSATRDL